MVNTQDGGTSQACRSDSDSSVLSFSVNIPTVDYSGDYEWILDAGATYQVVNRISFLALMVVPSSW